MSTTMNISSVKRHFFVAFFVLSYVYYWLQLLLDSHI